jgi:hypothetical protein
MMLGQFGNAVVCVFGKPFLSPKKSFEIIGIYTSCSARERERDRHIQRGKGDRESETVNSMWIIYSCVTRNV